MMNNTMRNALADEIANILAKTAAGVPVSAAVNALKGPWGKRALLVGGGAVAYHQGSKALEAQRLGRMILEQQKQQRG
jgi:hypothetical protein